MPNGRDQPRGRRGGPGQHFGDRPQRGEGRGPRNRAASIDTSAIQLGAPTPELFDGVARRCAEIVGIDEGSGRFRRENKPSQIRKFFDELVMWEVKVNRFQDEQKRNASFDEALPFIRMLNAKGAYAKGRQLVDENFQKLLGDCLRQVNDPKSLRHCRLFFEAFLGFYKACRPSDN